MCWFLTLAVPSAAVPALDRTCAAHERRLAFRRVRDTPTARVFPAGSTCVEVTAGGCSCGLYGEPAADPAAKPDRQRAKLLAKGWSHAQVDRALAARADSAARDTPDRANEADFKALVGELVQHAGTVHLHAHFHRGNQDTAEVPPAAVATLPLAEFLRAGFAPDTLVTLRR